MKILTFLVWLAVGIDILEQQTISRNDYAAVWILLLAYILTDD